LAGAGGEAGSDGSSLKQWSCQNGNEIERGDISGFAGDERGSFSATTPGP
jgi:hypothetical protein